GNDLLIGGEGLDLLDGGSGDDILIGGWTRYDSDLNCLASLLDEWNSSRSLTARRGNVLGQNPTADRLNGNFFLKETGADRSVFGHERDDFRGVGNDLLLGR